MKGKAGWAWELWSNGDPWSYERGAVFISAHKDKGEAKLHLRRLKSYHPEAHYYLKHRRVRARMKWGGARYRRANARADDRQHEGLYRHRNETYTRAKRDRGRRSWGRR